METVPEAVKSPANASNHAVKPRRSTKPPSVKASVVAKRVGGQTITQIAHDLEISRPTVYAILDESNIDAALEDGRLGAMKRVPQALCVLDNRLDKNSESAALWLLDKCFDGKDLGNKRMVGDVTLNQTLQVLLRSDSTPETAKDEKLNSPVINVVANESSDK
jgi:hypothetical protein